MIFRVKRRTPGLHKWKIVWPYQHGNTKRPSAFSTINQQKAWYFYWAVEALYKGKIWLTLERENNRSGRWCLRLITFLNSKKSCHGWSLENKDVSFHVFKRSWFWLVGFEPFWTFCQGCSGAKIGCEFPYGSPRFGAFSCFYYSTIPACSLPGVYQASSVLKGLRHEDFASLGQFCAKIITWWLYSYTKCSCNTKKKVSNEFY